MSIGKAGCSTRGILTPICRNNWSSQVLRAPNDYIPDSKAVFNLSTDHYWSLRTGLPREREREGNMLHMRAAHHGEDTGQSHPKPSRNFRSLVLFTPSCRC